MKLLPVTAACFALLNATLALSQPVKATFASVGKAAITCEQSLISETPQQRQERSVNHSCKWRPSSSHALP